MDFQLASLLRESVKDSLTRCRWLVVSTTLTAGAFLTLCWNAYFSWLRTIFFAPDASISPPMAQAAREHLLQKWLDSMYVSLPLVNISVQDSDLAFIGSIALFFLMMALFFSMRRSNHLIGRSLQLGMDAADQPPVPLAVKKYLYYGLSTLNIFTTVSTNDNPIEDLKPRDPQGARVWGVRSAFKLLFFLPSLAIFAVVSCDLVSSLALESVVRPGFAPPALSGIGVGSILKLIAFEFVAVVTGMLCLYFGKRCADYHKADAKILQRYSKVVYPPATPTVARAD